MNAYVLTGKGLEAGRTLEEEDSLDLLDTGKRERRSSFVIALVLAIAVSVMAAPVVEAAVTTIKGTVKVKDSTGDGIESEVIGPGGLFQTGGSTGALAVRTFAGGNAFMGAGDCTATPTATDPLTNKVEVEGGNIVTGIIMTGEMTVTVTSNAVGAGQLPLLNFKGTNTNPNVFIGLGNGLELDDKLILTCTAGSGNFVVVGQDTAGS